MEVINIKQKFLIKISVMLLIGVIIILINTIIKAKYIFNNEFFIANINIDRTKPQIKLIDITNTNKGYEKYANKNHKIYITVKIMDNNLKSIFCDKEHIKVKIEDKYVMLQNMNIIKVDNLEENIYRIELEEIKENGKLKIEFLEGVAIDNGDLKSDKVEFDTNIIIDNIPPKGEFVENKISDGKVNGIVNLSENIRKIEGWSLIENEGKFKIEKEFTNNISYQLPIRDLAGNEASIEINITKATYINLIYASLNSEVGWTYGYGNHDVAGAEAINKNPLWKTEVLAFNVSGNVEPDFLQARAYVYTHWGKDSIARCRYYRAFI